jgi:hypothetical protein
MTAPYVAPAEPFRLKIINNVWYMEPRGGPAVPFLPDLPAAERGRVLSHMLTTNNLGGPVIPPGVDRNSLVAQYGTYWPAIVPSDYRLNQCGARNRMADLTEYNSPTTTTLTWPTGTGTLTIQDKIIYGRATSWPRNVYFENCIFRGPRGFIGNESAIMDMNNPSPGQSVFLDCTFAPQNPQSTLNGLKGSRHKVERCHFIWCNDADGPYSLRTQNWATNVEYVASRSEAHVYFPGPWYANASPAYWDGSTYQATAADPPAISRTVADGRDNINNGGSYYDDDHKDGCHNDGIEVHGAKGSHVYDPETNRWLPGPGQTSGGIGGQPNPPGAGVHIWGSSFFTRDGFHYNYDPSGLGIPVPVVGGANRSTWSPPAGVGTRGWGDNPKMRPGPNQAQRPDMAVPVTSWGERQIDGHYPANGSGLIILQLENQYPSDTSVVLHDNLLDGGALGFQEQRKTYPSIAFTVYDQWYGPGWFTWSGTNYATFNQHVIRINDVGSLAAMPGVVDLRGRPAGHPDGPATWYQTQKWYDPNDYLGGKDGTVLPTTGTNGIRYF